VIEFLFETHATSRDNELQRASGHHDAPLSDRGEQQAVVLGARYGTRPLAAVYCSDLQHSYRTAEIAFAGRDIAIMRTALLRECDYGRFTRRPNYEVEAVRTRHVVEPFPGGESHSDVVQRVRQFFKGLRTAELDGQLMVVIGHRATYYALEHLLGRAALAEAVAAPWHWQPGWTYHF
jgi:broad specificity phosphatase PhoE